MYNWKFILGAAVLVCSTNSNAVIINTLNGIDYEWLELTETAGLSRNQVEAMLTDENSRIHGYQYASRQQIEDLFHSYVPAWDGLGGWHTNADEVIGAATLLNDFGVLAQSNSSNQTLTSVEGVRFYYHHEERNLGLYGNSEECEGEGRTCVAETYLLGSNSGDYHAAYIHSASGYDATYAPHPPTWHNDFSRTYAGSYLVRPAEVPVPAAVWLFGSGLIGLIGLVRRKKA